MSGRKLKQLDDKTIARINLYWWSNQQNITNIARWVGHSPSICQRHIFKNRDMYDLFMERLK